MFGKRTTGSGMLGGEVVSYYDMYETPMRMRMGASRSGDGGAYRSVAGEDPEQMV